MVGPEPPVTFSVHENVICSSSEFFKKAMSGEWKESNERSIRLENDKPEVFQIYMHWLYHCHLPVRIDDPGLAGNAEYVQLANAYILGDILQDVDFKDAVIDAMIDKSSSNALDGHHWFPVGPVIREIYDNTLESSKARRLLVDLYTHHGDGAWLYNWAAQEDLPKGFLLDLAIALLDKREKPELHPSGSPCEYHEHAPGESFCYRNRLTSISRAPRVDSGQE